MLAGPSKGPDRKRNPKTIIVWILVTPVIPAAAFIGNPDFILPKLSTSGRAPAATKTLETGASLLFFPGTQIIGGPILQQYGIAARTTFMDLDSVRSLTTIRRPSDRRSQSFPISK